MPFFDQKKVVDILDRIDDMDDGGRVANDTTLMYIASACVLHERFQLAA
jgi:asparagine synthase (glutamine-hydrolysing)